MAKASTSIFRITSFAAQTRFIEITLTVLVLIGSADADVIFRLGQNIGGSSSNISNANLAAQAGEPKIGFVPSTSPQIRVQVLSETNPLCSTSGGVFESPSTCLGQTLEGSTGFIHEIT